VQRAIAGFCELTTINDDDEKAHHVLKTAIEEEPLLALRFKSFKVCYRSNQNTLIPSELFDAKSLDEYFDWVTEPDEKEILVYDYIKNLDAFNVFSIHKKLFKKLNDTFSNPKLFDLNSVIIQNLLRENKGTRDKKMFVYKENNSLHIYLIENGKLIFSNIFSIETEEDFVYYVLAVCEQLHINTASLQVVLMGDIEKGNSFHELLTSYLENISFADFPKGIYMPQEMQHVPAHRFHHLFALALCE
jgi:hypothetical protein